MGSTPFAGFVDCFGQPRLVDPEPRRRQLGDFAELHNCESRNGARNVVRNVVGSGEFNNTLVGRLLGTRWSWMRPLTTAKINDASAQFADPKVLLIWAKQMYYLNS